ncbi:hypothetical protein [Pseudomonas graminis]
MKAIKFFESVFIFRKENMSSGSELLSEALRCSFWGIFTYVRPYALAQILIDGIRARLSTPYVGMTVST